jgi:hypothetical protein
VAPAVERRIAVSSRTSRVGRKANAAHLHLAALVQATARFSLSQSRSVAALAFHHLVAFLDQALAFAILALGLLLDVRAFFIGHDGLQGEVVRLDCDRRMRAER